MHQALGLIKFYFAPMKIALPGLPVEAVLCLAQDTDVNVDKVRTNYIHDYRDNQRHFNKYIYSQLTSCSYRRADGQTQTDRRKETTDGRRETGLKWETLIASNVTDQNKDVL